MLRKIISIIVLGTVIFSSFSLFCSAYELEHVEASVGGYYLYNFENDFVMAEQGLEDIISPSSTTKMMTACIAMESGIDYNRIITVTSAMLDGVTGRNMRLKVGDKLTFGDLLYATICGGYNDASQALALSICDTLDQFIDMMNDKARELGMNSTTYLNVTGINATGMTSSVNDIAILAKYMSEKDEYVEISATISYPLSQSATCTQSTISNRSSLLDIYGGISNFNTGSGDFGDCTVLYYKTGELSFLCILMNVNSYDRNDSENYAEVYARKLLTHALKDHSIKTVLTNKNVITSVPVKYAVSVKEVELYLKDDLKLFLPNDIDLQNDLVYSTNIFDSELKAPLADGEIVGELIVSLEGRILTKAPLILRENIDKNGFLYFMEAIKDYVLSRSFLLTVIIFVLIMSAYYIIKRRHIKIMYKRGGGRKVASGKKQKK